MGLFKNLRRWFILVLARLVAIAALIFALVRGAEGFRDDVKYFHDCKASGDKCQPTQQVIIGADGNAVPIDKSITGLVPGSTVPFHKSGFFFTCLHWTFYLVSLAFVLLIELPNCTRLHRTIEAFVSLLLPVNHHSIAPQGAAMVYLGLDGNSRSVTKACRVSGWLLMVIGFLYIFLSLVFICFNVRQMRSFNLTISRNALATRASFKDVLRRRRDELMGKQEEECQPLPTQKRAPASTKKFSLFSLKRAGSSSSTLEEEKAPSVSHISVGMPEPAHLPSSLSRSSSALSGKTLAPSGVLPYKTSSSYKSGSPSLASSSRIDLDMRSTDEFGEHAHRNAQ